MNPISSGHDRSRQPADVEDRRGDTRRELPQRTPDHGHPGGRRWRNHVGLRAAGCAGELSRVVRIAGGGDFDFSINSQQLPEGGYVFGYTRSYPREFLTTDTNADLLRKMAEAGHGRFAPDPSQIFERPKHGANRSVDVTDYFLSLALLLSRWKSGSAAGLGTDL